tara:strand:+ start:978 stop:1652 length:675 start_codon:yes stop_codon:yes gene_type:complete
MKKVVIKDKYFSPQQKEDSQSKFNDKNALGFAWRPGQEEFSIEIDSCTIDGRGVSEGLKLSFCRNVSVKNSCILGGYEDCVDIVRGENIFFENCTFISQNSAQHITCKSGVRNVNFINCKFVNPVRNWWNGACIDLGNWSDYDDADRPKVRNVNITNCTMSNNCFSILYRRLYSDSPSVINSSGLKLNIASVFVRAFWFLQRRGMLGARRRFDESWLKVYDFEL